MVGAIIDATVITMISTLHFRLWLLLGGLLVVLLCRGFHVLLDRSATTPHGLGAPPTNAAPIVSLNGHWPTGP